MRAQRFSALFFGVVSLAAGVAEADPPVRDDLIALDAHIRAHPNDVAAFVQRSELYLRDRQPDEALADLRYAEALQPGDPRVAAQRGAILHALGREDEALAELDAAIARSAPSMAMLTLRARVLEALGRLEDALEDYDAALALGDEVDLHLQRGRICEQLGRDADAAVGYEAGMRALGGAVTLRVAAIEADLRSGHADRALVLIDEGMTAARARARWLLLRERALRALGRDDEARAAATEALAEIDARIVRAPTEALREQRAAALRALGGAR